MLVINLPAVLEEYQEYMLSSYSYQVSLILTIKFH